MRNRLGRWLALVGVVVAISLVAIVLGQVASWSGLRDRWRAERLQAEAERIEAVARREAQWPLIAATLADTATATAGAALDKVLLLGLVAYLLLEKRQQQDGGHDVRR